MVKFRNIGIKKDIGIRLAVSLTAFMILLCLSGIFFGFYFDADYRSEMLNKYGVEVETEWAEVITVYEDDGYSYELKYYYTDTDGSVFTGTSGRFSSYFKADSHIGERIIITYVPNSKAPNKFISVHKRYADLAKPKYKLHLALAISCAVPVPLFAYILCYRAIYRNALDEKIIIGYENGDLPQRLGEVVKVCGWLIKYVKVRYEDEGKVCERWSRTWWTRREAKYLEERKFIKIVPYKHTYGIMEVMQIETRSKKTQHN